MTKVGVGSLLLFCKCLNVCACVLRHFSPTLCDPTDCSLLGSPVHWIFWRGLLCPPTGDLSDPGIKPACPASPALQADSLPTETPGSP